MKDKLPGSLGRRADSAKMARSNPSAIGRVSGHPLPERPSEPIEDCYLEGGEERGAYLPREPSSLTSSSPTPVPGMSPWPVWSDATLTGSLSGRYSTFSWGAEEGELDRLAAETVRRLFGKINGALYRGKTTGTLHVDRECHEWSSHFPHLGILGIHLFDLPDDGTEVDVPDPLAIRRPPDESVKSALNYQCETLSIIGQGVDLKPVKNLPDYEYLCEEVIAAHGIVEEYLAFDNTDEDPAETRKKSRLKRYHGLPPVTPNVCLREAVCSQVFDQVWGEMVALLHPLITRINEKAISGCSSAYSLHGPGVDPTCPSPLGIGPLQHQPYVLRGLRDPPTLTMAHGQSGSQHLRFKHSAVAVLPPVPPPSGTLPQLPSAHVNLTGLQDVMKIRSLSLQQRVSSSYTAHMMPLEDPVREGTPSSFARPESGVLGLRPGRTVAMTTTPLPPRTSDYQLPATPAGRLISSRLTNRRNLPTLKPLEKTKGPCLVPIDDGIRGYRLCTHGSPPSTPYVRHTQLPPLDPAPSATSQALERSPPMTIRGRNRVTFSSRIVSAADTNDPWRLPRPSGGELRPNTTNTFRAEATRVGRRGSDHGLTFGGSTMKVVGHAAGLREKTSFAEDEEIPEEEEEEGESSSYTLHTTSGFLQPKPKSGRTRLRGHMR